MIARLSGIEANGQGVTVVELELGIGESSDTTPPKEPGCAPGWTAMSFPSSRSAPADRNGLIWATAFVHGMTILTRNVANFRLTGVHGPSP